MIDLILKCLAAGAATIFVIVLLMWGISELIWRKRTEEMREISELMRKQREARL